VTRQAVSRKIARLAGVALTAAVLMLPGSAWASGSFTAGSPGLGDPFFPLAGNGGYDVSHYSLRLDYDVATRRLVGSAVISATATQNLSRFDLDLRGFDVSRVTVDGRAASFRRDGQELVITLRTGLRDRRGFTVAVDYAGVPDVITDPDGSIEGWVPTATARSWWGSRRGPRGGIRSTTTHATRRRSTSRSPSRAD
jgi:hypothetical protein